ncbi:phosphate ABC transporter ATP-binding protein [candidate division WOR-3 bacterium]|nr:phosphate ABC transporter ATP-binding protein [candidate division WOR-3 bacterium]
MKEKITLEHLTVTADGKSILTDINLTIFEHEIFSIIGPAHSGKTTLLRTINRLIETNPGFTRTGKLLLDGKDVWNWDIDTLRRRVGLIFATPIPLPGTIFDNIAYGPRLKGIRNLRKLTEIVEQSLRAAFLWDEVKDRLFTSALRLSGGQQQRLCIARALALDPEVVMMDEPCSGLDPISTAQIEDAMRQLKTRYTFILVTNNVKQAARVSDRVAFFLAGQLIEVNTAEIIFTRPADQRTDDYISGRIG